MAYAVKYILQFASDRGNEIRIEVLKKDYQGEVIYKSLGGSPSLSIEQGDGAIKGSSLVFAMQADVEGELQELYTTDNKQFKVNMYRNEVLSWQGYILPELYSEEYVDAPYDVSVTATDQLATLKAITYQRGDVNVSLSTIIEDILSFTQISVPVTYHQNLSALRKGEVPMLVDSHISQAAYNGYSCYDVLNNILLSCNCCIMQINGEWLITSLTNSTTNYYTAGVTQVREHKALGQLGVGEVCPAGTLTMVNNPALKGAKVEYAHMLRHSFLVNADCVDREGWNYTPDSRNPIDIPGEREAFGKIFKAYCWELHPVNIRENNSLQLWQEVSLEKDERNYYDLSVKTLFGTNAKLLLMAVTYLGSDGIERRLTAEGWIETWDKSDVNYYIQITGKEKNAGLDAIADIEQYEMSTVQFALPPVDGTMRVGFINSTTDYAEPLASAPIYVSQVYLTVSGVTGQECTTEVEPNATQEQQDVLLAYGDTFESENAYKLGLNTLKKSSGENITSWWLDNINFSSYYNTMLQEFSRYFGVKKAQLQGIIMGKDVLSDMYADVFSGRVMRLLSAQVDLLADEASVTVEEVVTTTVDFDTVIYATNNTNSFGSSSGGGAGTSGGASSTAGESLLGVQSDGDVYVKDGRALVGQEGRFENLALPVDAPTERKETRTYLYSSDPSKGAIDIAKIAKWIDEQEEMWVLDAENGVIKTTYNVVSEQEIISCRRASGSGSGGGGGITEITAQMVVDALGYVPYSSLNPAGYITSAALNGYATETWVSSNYQPKGNYLTSVAWGDVSGKPTTLGGYGITDAISTSGGTISGNLSVTGTSAATYFLTNGHYLFARSGADARWVVTDESWNHEYSLYHSGNFNPADYLPKSGGTMSGDIVMDGTWLQMYKGTVQCGYNASASDYEPLYMKNGAWQTLIHSGNIGSYALVYNSGSNSLIGVTSDYGGKIQVNGGAKFYIEAQNNHTDTSNLAGDKTFSILYAEDNRFGLNLWLNNNGSVTFQPSYFNAGTDATYNLNLCPLGGNVLVGTTSGIGHSYGRLQVYETSNEWGSIIYTNNASVSSAHIGGYGMLVTSSNNNNGTYLLGIKYNDPFLIGAGLPALFVKDNGNILIGTEADNGAKLQIHTTSGAQSVRINSTVNEYGYDYNAVGIYHNNNIKLSFGWNSEPKSASNAGAYFKNYVSGATISLFNEGGIYFSDNVLIGTDDDDGNKLSVNGNIKSYGSITAVNWLYSGADCGMYITNTGVYYSNNANYANIESGGNEICIGGNTSGSIYVNYRVPRHYNIAPTSWIWCAGSSDSRADHYIGSLIATGEVISSRRASSSDARLKDNINRLIAEDCLAMVRNLQPSSWDWKENGEHSMGFIAQDIEPLMPYAVTKIKDEVLGQRLNLQYDQFFAPVVGAIQCLDTKFNTHEDEIETLKKRVKYLENKLQEYGYNRY